MMTRCVLDLGSYSWRRGPPRSNFRIVTSSFALYALISRIMTPAESLEARSTPQPPGLAPSRRRSQPRAAVGELAEELEDRRRAIRISGQAEDGNFAAIEPRRHHSRFGARETVTAHRPARRDNDR